MGGIIGLYNEEGSISLFGPDVAERGGGGRSVPKLGVELRNLESSSRRIMYDSVLICEMEEGPGALPATIGNASFPGLCLPEVRTVGDERFDPGLGLGLYCLDDSGCGGRGHVEDTGMGKVDGASGGGRLGDLVEEECPGNGKLPVLLGSWLNNDDDVRLLGREETGAVSAADVTGLAELMGANEAVENGSLAIKNDGSLNATVGAPREVCFG